MGCCRVQVAIVLVNQGQKRPVLVGEALYTARRWCLEAISRYAREGPLPTLVNDSGGHKGLTRRPSCHAVEAVHIGVELAFDRVDTIGQFLDVTAAPLVLSECRHPVEKI